MSGSLVLANSALSSQISKLVTINNLSGDEATIRNDVVNDSQFLVKSVTSLVQTINKHLPNLESFLQTVIQDLGKPPLPTMEDVAIQIMENTKTFSTITEQGQETAAQAKKNSDDVTSDIKQLSTDQASLTSQQSSLQGQMSSLQSAYNAEHKEIGIAIAKGLLNTLGGELSDMYAQLDQIQSQLDAIQSQEAQTGELLSQTALSITAGQNLNVQLSNVVSDMQGLSNGLTLCSNNIANAIQELEDSEGQQSSAIAIFYLQTALSDLAPVKAATKT